jgi:hypothetical protein
MGDISGSTYTIATWFDFRALQADYLSDFFRRGRLGF